MNKNVRKLTDGAMVVAIVGVCLLIDRQLAGVLSSLFSFLMPLPMVFYATKYGMKDSVVVLVAMVLLAVVLGTPMLIFLVASASITGFIYGGCVKKRLETRKTILITMAVSIVSMLLSTFVLASILGYNFMEEVNMMEETMTMVMEQTNMVAPMMDLHQMMLSVFFVSTILIGVLEGYIVHIISRVMLKRLRIYVEPIEPIGTYLPPKWSGYVGIAGFFLYMYVIRYPQEVASVQIALQAISFACMLYLAMYGMVALLIFLTSRNPKHRGLNTILAIFMLFTLLPFISILGYLYITTDVHRQLLERGNYAKRD